MCASSLPAWKIKLAIGYTSPTDQKELKAYHKNDEKLPSTYTKDPWRVSM